jgi:hypothetical protein
MECSARLFHCAGCHGQVIICRHCDRGHRYCSRECARLARQTSRLAAAQRYQTSRRGRHQHARRQQVYRQRQQKKVTHQSSPLPAADDLLPPRSREWVKPKKRSTRPDDIRCDFCGRRCSRFLRRGFLHQSAAINAPATAAGWYGLSLK